MYADDDGQEGRKSKFTAGRGKRLANRNRDELRAQVSNHRRRSFSWQQIINCTILKLFVN